MLRLVLVILADVPTFGCRPRYIRNGLAMPQRMTLNNILQVLGKPNWAVQTLKYGKPSFRTLGPYMPKGVRFKAIRCFYGRYFFWKIK